MKFLSELKSHDALVAALVSAIGYVTAYVYQLGKFNFFDLPSELIQVGLEQVISSTLIVAFFMLVIYTFDHFSNKVSFLASDKKQKPLSKVTVGLLLIVGWITLTYFLGGYFTAVEDIYATYHSDSGDYILVGTVNDNLLLTKYDPETRIVYKEVLLLPPTNSIELKSIRTERLKPAK